MPFSINTHMPPEFVADAMLKKLARWLRIFGAKTDYIPSTMQDSKILKLMREKKNQNKILLTQDVQLHERAELKGFQSFLVPREVPVEEQVAAVLREFHLSLTDFPSNTLCPSCNGELRVAKKSEVKGKVHENVYKAHRKFWLCGKCGKAYWEGTHWERIGEAAKRVNRLLREKE